MDRAIVELDATEVASVKELVASLGDPAAIDDWTLTQVALSAQELPRRVRRILHEFKVGSRGDVLRISTTPQMIGAAPPTPGVSDSSATVSPYDVLLLVFASLVGEPFGWQNCQAGRLVQDVLPTPGFEDEQRSMGSREALYLHTEDAFNPLSPDFLVLLCVRNESRVPTWVSRMSNLDLSDPRYDILFETYLAHNAADEVSSAADDSPMPAAGLNMRRPVLYGDRAAPRLNYDANNFRRPDNPEAEAALAALEGQLHDELEEVCLQPGDICLLDNSRVVHGRPGFEPNYDGADRWLKRTCLTFDLRKLRPYSIGRVLQEA